MESHKFRVKSSLIELNSLKKYFIQPNKLLFVNQSSIKTRALREANKAFRVYEENEINNIIKDAIIIVTVILMFSVCIIL